MNDSSKYLGKRAYIEEVYAGLINQCKSVLHHDLQLICEDYPNSSRRLSELELQEACIVRNNLRAQKISQVIIDDNGKFNMDRLTSAAAYVKEALYPSGWGREDDVPRQKHLLWVLESLRDKSNLRFIIENLSLPMGGIKIIEIVRATLRVKEDERITDMHLKRSVVCAALTYLRQNVGSCFATAPSIIIQTEQLEQFLIDMKDLIERSALHRVIRGVEYSVPMTYNWGSGDWEKPFAVNKDTALHLHPGMMIGLEKSGILNAKSSRGRLKEAKKLFAHLLKFSTQNSGVGIVKPEMVFREILARFFEITSEEIEDAELQEKLLWERNTPFDQARPNSQRKAYLKYKAAYEKAKIGFITLTDCALLKCWEYTLASFAEAQDDFAKWNLYTSLGLSSGMQGGIADCVTERLQGILETLNRDLDHFKEEYDQMASMVDYQHARLQRANTEEDAKWQKMELKRLTGKLQLVEKDFRSTERKSQRIANLLPTLLNAYLKYFPIYFQEVYDPDMRDISSSHLFDDSPAGFRLLFKFGRSQADQWKLIYSADQYISSLVEFFVLTEQELVREPEFEGLEDEISRLVTLIVQHVKTDEFLEGALRRMGSAHHTNVGKNPLKNLNTLDKKPWSYVSGGSMSHMIQCYYSLESSPRQREKRVLGEVELLTFYIDLMKTAGENLTKALYKNPEKKILAYSPTHAFLYQPFQRIFSEAYQSKMYTYTYIRDEYINPRKKILTTWLDRNAIQWLMQKLCLNAPVGTYDRILELFRSSPDHLTPIDFRDRFAKVQKSREASFFGFSDAHLDALLYQSLPFTPTSEVLKEMRPIIENVCKKLDFPTRNITNKFSGWVNKAKYAESWDSYTLQALFKIFISEEKKTAYFPYNIHNEVFTSFSECGMSVLPPLIVADTNWTKFYFAFVVNPGTVELELWRVNAIGNQGFPMSSWRAYMDGHQHSVWGIYSRPQEYDRE